MSDGKLTFDTAINPEGVQAGLSQLKTIFKVGIAGIVAKQGADILKMGIDYNAQMEQYQASFNVLLGNANKASKHIAGLKKMAEKTPFEMGDLAQASQTLLAFGDDANKVQGHLKMLGDISLGNKEKFNGLALVFGQVQSQGKLMGQDLLQMINAGFNPLKVISEETGESMSALKDKMAKGQITFEDVAHAMEVATSKGGQFYGGLEAQSKTFSGQMSTLRDNINAFIGQLSAPVFDFLASTVLPKAIEGLTWMINNLPVVESILGAVGAALTTAFAIKKFDMIKNAITGIASSIKVFIATNPWLLLAAAIAAVTAALVIFIKSGGDIDALGDKIEGVVKNVVKAVPGVAKKISELIPKIVGAITKALPSIIKTGVEILKALLTGIIQALPALVAAGITLLVAFVDGLLDALPVLMEALPSIIEALINGLVGMLPQIIEAGAKILEMLAMGIIQAIPTLVAMLPKIIQAMVMALAGLSVALITVGANLLSQLWNGISSWISTLWANVTGMANGTFTQIVQGLGSLYNSGRNWLAGLWSGISAWVGNLFSNVYGAAAGLPGRLKSGIGSLYSVGANWLIGLWNGIGNKAAWVYNQVTRIGHNILNRLKSVFKTHSPSRATMAIGEMVGKGLGIGIENETDSILKKVAAQAKAVTQAYTGVEVPELKPGFVMPKLQSNIHPYAIEGQQPQTQIINQTININQPVKTPHETARALRKEAISLGLAGAR